MTAELRADDFHAAFGPDAGVLPDGWIEESNAEDWPVVLAAITGDRAIAIWASDRAPVKERDLRERAALNETFSVVLSPGVQLNFFAGPEVLFDIDLRELQNQAAVDALGRFMAHLGTACRKPVVLAPEGEVEACVRFDPEAGTFTVRSLTDE